MKRVNVMNAAVVLPLLAIGVLLFMAASKILAIELATLNWKWDAVEAIGTWFAGLAATAAVVLSLCLALQASHAQWNRDLLLAHLAALRCLLQLERARGSLGFHVVMMDALLLQRRVKTDDPTFTAMRALEFEVAPDDQINLSLVGDKFPIQIHDVSQKVRHHNVLIEFIQMHVEAASHVPIGGARAIQERRNDVTASILESKEHAEKLSEQIGGLIEECGRFTHSTE